MFPRHSFFSPFLTLLALSLAVPGIAGECASFKSSRPEWIFCDDFETTGPLVASGRYFEMDDNKGDFRVQEGSGWKGTRGMRALWQAGEVDAGNLKLGFGRIPATYMNKGIRANEDFREVYYRMYVRAQEGWVGDPYKLSRATVIAKADWSQAMIAHIWGDRSEHLQVDPATCVDGSGNVTCSGYNDFAKLKWIGAKAGLTKPFTGTNAGKWICVEAHVKLNDAGQSNGVQEFWINDALEARREGLNFVGSFKGYGINGVFLENHWNSGSPKVQERSFDNFVVSTKRIGCAEGGQAATPVTPPVTPPRIIKPLPPSGSLMRGPGVIPWVRALSDRRSLIGRSIGPGGASASPFANPFARPRTPVTVDSTLSSEPATPATPTDPSTPSIPTEPGILSSDSVPSEPPAAEPAS